MLGLRYVRVRSLIWRTETRWSSLMLKSTFCRAALYPCLEETASLLRSTDMSTYSISCQGPYPQLAS